MTQIEAAHIPYDTEPDAPPPRTEGRMNGAILSAPDGGAVTAIWTLTAGSCRFPIGSPDSAAFRFCGKDRLPGHSYCRAHCAVVYKPPADPRRGEIRPAVAITGHVSARFGNRPASAARLR
jgi:hypothetical protein